MLPYPNSLPLADVALLVSDIKNGTFVSDAPRAVKAVWELAGYAAFMSIGEPSAINPPSPSPSPAPVPLPSLPPLAPKIHMAMQAAPSLSTEQVVEYLELFLSHAKKDLTAVVQDLPWLSILKWAYAQLLGAI